MLRLLGSLQHVHRQYWLTYRSLRLLTPKLDQSRFIVPHTQTVLHSNQSFSIVMDALSSSTCQGAGTLDDVIARSKNSTEVQKLVLELPEVSRIPARKRTFHLSHGELETHVRPLLSCHWHVGYVGDRVVDDRQVLSLNKLFSFKSFRSAVEFFDGLADVQDEEDHHARITLDYSSVYVSSHTHIAYQRASDTDLNATPIRIPGLTARDVRFAVKVERLHEKFLNDERAVTRVPVDSAVLQAWSMEQLRRRYSMSREDTGGNIS